MYKKLAYDYAQQEKFTWKYVSDKFNDIIFNMLEDDNSLSKEYIDISTYSLDNPNKEIIVAGEK